MRAPPTTRSSPPTSAWPATTTSCRPSTRTGTPSAPHCGRRPAASCRRRARRRERPHHRRRADRRASTSAEELRALGEEESHAEQHRLAAADRSATSSTSRRRRPTGDWATAPPGSPRCPPRSTATSRRCALPPRAGTSCRAARSRSASSSARTTSARTGSSDAGPRAPRPPTAPSCPRRCAPTCARGAERGERGLRPARDVPARRAAAAAPATPTRSAASATRRTRAASSAPSVDLDETYAWGQEELARIVAEMEQTAERIKPGASVLEAIELLDPDPRAPARRARRAAGVDAARSPTPRSPRSPARHFDIPEPIRRLECRIAPTDNGGIYYTGPSDDLVTRPGRMWWSVPEGRHDVRHVAGAHDRLPRGRAGPSPAGRPDGLPPRRAQPLAAARRRWISGYGEGWALYAEQLMADLGFLDDPADYLGMLDAQSLRAARVVLDIGIHCELPAPASVGGGDWDYDKAWQFLAAHCHSAEGTRRFELDRYLGWPGPGAVLQGRAAAVAAAARGGPRAARATASTCLPSTAARSTSARSGWTCCARRCSASFDD